jgi:hypothetical protein
MLLQFGQDHFLPFNFLLIKGKKVKAIPLQIYGAQRVLGG